MHENNFVVLWVRSGVSTDDFCFLRQVYSLFDRLDLKKGGILRRADFDSYCDDNPDFLLLFLIGKPSLL